uniref:PIH1 domain-containing protein 2 n=1 Tax=Varanus komodoensis TaxID=61221 RepID=A0A8D2Q763_VARKO
METRRDSEDMLAKVTQLWTMLDDMAESNPEGYRQFMREQLKDVKQYYAPPEPFLCLEARIVDPTEKLLFVNICSWSKVPAPQSPSEPVPLSAGKMEEVSDESEVYSVLDIAYNPSVLERGKDDPVEKDQLICLSLKYIEEHYDVTLSHSYSSANFKLKGKLERMRQSFRREQAPVLSSQGSTNKGDSELTLLLKDVAPSKPCIIEEISSTEAPEELRTPAYAVSTRKDADGNALQIELRVELPEVHCISECNLSVSKDDILIECPDKYRLQLDLPQPVNEEATAATFYKRKGVLHVTMPVWRSK